MAAPPGPQRIRGPGVGGDGPEEDLPYPPMTDWWFHAFENFIGTLGQFEDRIWYCDPYVVCGGTDEDEHDYKMIEFNADGTVFRTTVYDGGQLEDMTAFLLSHFNPPPAANAPPAAMGALYEIIATLHSRIQNCEQVDLQCYKNH